jgi:signal peptidase I
MRNEATEHFLEMARAVLGEGSRLSFRAGGKSMSPFIHDNETVIIEPPARTLRIGDVILFEGKGRQLILHRIVRNTKKGYVTRGDAARHDDGTVSHSAVLGRAVHVVDGLNFHLRFPLSTLVAFALRLRERSMLFNILRIPGSLLLCRLRVKDHL